MSDENVREVKLVRRNPPCLNCEKLEKDKAELQKVIQHGTEELVNVTQERDKLQKLVDELEIENKGLEAINSVYGSELSELRKENEELKKISGRCEYCKDCESLRKENEELKQNVTKLRVALSDDCEACASGDKVKSLRALLKEVIESMSSDFQSKCDCEICAKREELLTKIREAVK